MNVEVSSDIKVVKYIYKYICKYHDKIAFHIHNSDTEINIDGIKEYQSARWVSPSRLLDVYLVFLLVKFFVLFITFNCI